MQKIATKVFVYASTVFGLLGIVMVLTIPNKGGEDDGPNIVILKLLFATGFVVLSSFALSVASKYLNGKS